MIARIKKLRLSENGGDLMPTEKAQRGGIRKFFDFASPFYNLFQKLVFAGQRENYRRIAIGMMDLSGDVVCLDVGTGTGRTAKTFVEVNKNSLVVGVDISKRMIRRARKMRGENTIFLVGDAEHLPFRDMVFDLVMMWAAWGIIDPKGAVPEMIRTTKEGGNVAICEVETHLSKIPYLRPFFIPFSIFERFFREGAQEGLPTPRDFFEKLGLYSVTCLKLRKSIADIELTLGEKQSS